MQERITGITIALFHLSKQGQLKNPYIPDLHKKSLIICIEISPKANYFHPTFLMLIN